jgi:hypothetical protein
MTFLPMTKCRLWNTILALFHARVDGQIQCNDARAIMPQVTSEWVGTSP